MSLALTRSRRSNAGSKMSTLIKQQLEAGLLTVGVDEELLVSSSVSKQRLDQNAQVGEHQVSEMTDNQVEKEIIEFSSQQEELESVDNTPVSVKYDNDFFMERDEDDIIDSDFASTDEEDLIDEEEFERLLQGDKRKKDVYIVEDEEEMEKRMKRKAIVAGFMHGKKPRKLRRLDRDGGSKQSTFDLVETKSKIKRTSSIKLPADLIPMRQSGRSHAIANKQKVEQKIREKEKRRATLPKRVRAQVKQLTQEELIAEALETEKLNLATVKQIEALEDERRKRGGFKRKKEITGPAIRYVSMSLIEDIPQDLDEICSNLVKSVLRAVEEELNFDGIKLRAEDETAETEITVSRNFLVFDNFEYDPLEDFGLSEKSTEVPYNCPITGKKPPYRLPEYLIPYGNLQAHKVIHEVLDNKYPWSPLMGCYIQKETQLFNGKTLENLLTSTGKSDESSDNDDREKEEEDENEDREGKGNHDSVE